MTGYTYKFIFLLDLARSAGADNVIGKPFPINELREMIANYI
ncbi:MAG TPA: hypothetical protein VIM75_00445 [Ohtaekwangia sp.]